MNASPSEQGRGLPSALERFLCLYCGGAEGYQPFVCPGFGQHSPSPTLIRIGDHAQCTQCQAHVAHATCEICGHVTALTADILDDPFGSRYTRERQDDQQVAQLDELGGRFIRLVYRVPTGRIDETYIDEAYITELQFILAERERLLNSLPEKYPRRNRY
jgi:hypothetical protein